MIRPRGGGIAPPSHEPLYDDYARILKKLRESTGACFAPSLWSLGDFRANRLGVATISFVSNDRIVIDIIGPGHDPASICKGIINAPISISMKEFAPPLLEIEDRINNLPFYLDIRDEARDLSASRLAVARERRRRKRIEWLAGMEGMAPDEYIAFARRMGWNNLFTGEAELNFAQVEKLFQFAIRYAKFKAEHNLPYNQDTLGFTIIAGGKYSLDNAWDGNRYKG